MVDPDDCVLWSVRVEASSFDGSLDPKIYLNWEVGMDHFFEWYDMTNVRRIRFAKMRLTGQAKTYWRNVGRLMEMRRQVSVSTWDEMKFMLREKYVPTTYFQRLLDQW